MSQENSLLEQGIRAIKNGDKQKARTLLVQEVKQNPKNENAWLWLSTAVETNQHKKACFDKVLEMNPNNKNAIRGLNNLKQQPVENEKNSLKTTSREPQNKATSNKRFPKKLIIGIALGIMATCIFFSGGILVALQADIISFGNKQTSNIESPATDIFPTSTTRELPPTWTPTPKLIPSPTSTRTPTNIPKPTNTRYPTKALTPTLAPEVKTIGPIWDSIYDESHTMEISVLDIKFNAGNSYNNPKSGNMYVVVYLSIKNLGPDTARFVSDMDFDVKDSNGVIRSSGILISGTQNCDLDFADLSAGGILSGCIGYEVPKTGSLELIYAPFQYDNLEEGRYLSFAIR